MADLTQFLAPPQQSNNMMQDLGMSLLRGKMQENAQERGEQRDFSRRIAWGTMQHLEALKSAAAEDPNAAQRYRNTREIALNDSMIMDAFEGSFPGGGEWFRKQTDPETWKLDELSQTAYHTKRAQDRLEFEKAEVKNKKALAESVEEVYPFEPKTGAPLTPVPRHVAEEGQTPYLTKEQHAAYQNHASIVNDIRAKISALGNIPGQKVSDNAAVAKDMERDGYKKYSDGITELINASPNERIRAIRIATSRQVFKFAEDLESYYKNPPSNKEKNERALEYLRMDLAKIKTNAGLAGSPNGDVIVENILTISMKPFEDYLRPPEAGSVTPSKFSKFWQFWKEAAQIHRERTVEQTISPIQ